jgi:hypothetical protein
MDWWQLTRMFRGSGEVFRQRPRRRWGRRFRRGYERGWWMSHFLKVALMLFCRGSQFLKSRQIPGKLIHGNELMNEIDLINSYKYHIDWSYRSEVVLRPKPIQNNVLQYISCYSYRDGGLGTYSMLTP